jgi:hypothetical protein
VHGRGRLDGPTGVGTPLGHERLLTRYYGADAGALGGLCLALAHQPAGRPRAKDQSEYRACRLATQTSALYVPTRFPFGRAVKPDGGFGSMFGRLLLASRTKR